MLKFIKSAFSLLFSRLTGGCFYTYHEGRFYSAPSSRQLGILKSYLCADRQFQNREVISTDLIKMAEGADPVILDVGGNVGYSAIHYSRVLKQKGGGQCFTFEPYEPNFSHIIRNAHSYDNIFPLTLGLSNYSAVVDFGVPEYIDKLSKDVNNTGFVSYKGLGHKNVNSVKGVLTKGDELEFLHGDCINVVYIKIDTEGSEFEVVQGLFGVIGRHKPFIQIEYNPYTLEFDLVRSIYQKIREFGYKLYSDCPLVVGKQCELYFIPDAFSEKVEILDKLYIFYGFD